MSDLKLPACTGVGSLPHHNVDSALEYSFRMDIPFLPQIPIRNSWEYMIAQALEGVPGLEPADDGSVTLNREVWEGRSPDFDRRLLSAFSSSAQQDAFSGFEPSPASYSCWQPFIWELEERGHKVAKIQLAGPLTAQWILRLREGGTAEDRPEVGVQIFRLVLARALAMCRRLQSHDIQPLLFLDEPGFFGFNRKNPQHLMGVQELKIVVQTLKKEGVIVGLHCCSNTDWETIFGVGLDFVSLDTELSLDNVLELEAPKAYVEGGGRFAFGVLPTSLDEKELQAVEPGVVWEGLRNRFLTKWGKREDLVKKALQEALYTPACGLALRTTTAAENFLTTLRSVTQCVKGA